MTTTPNSILVPIKSRVVTTETNNGVSSESVAVQIGSTQYTAPPLLDGALGGFQVCIFAADTLELIENQSFSTNPGLDESQTATDQQQYMVNLLNAQGENASPVIIISSIGTQPVGQYPTDSAYNFNWGMLWQKVQRLGGGAFMNLAGDATYSLISQSGIGSELSSTVHTSRADFASNIEGYLQQDTNGNYHFVYPEFIDFETQAVSSIPGDSAPGIRVDGKFYPAATENGSVGCQVCIFERDTLEFIDNKWFATAGLDPLTGQQAMSNFLKGYEENNNVLVFVSGFGFEPILVQPGTPQSDSLHDQISNLGVVNVYDVLSETSLSLIGSPGLSAGEAVVSGTAVIPAKSGNLVGLLHKDDSGWYRPLIYTSDAGANNDLCPIIYQPLEPFPSMDDDELLAYQHINNVLLHGNPNDKTIRDAYYDLNYPLDTETTTLSNLPYPDSSEYSQTAFNTVKSQILSELGYVSGIQKLFDNIRHLNDQLEKSKHYGLDTVVSNLQVSTTDDNNDKTNMFWLGVIRTALMVAAIVDPEPASKMFIGIAAAGLFLGMNSENTIGNPAVKPTQYPIYQLETTIGNAFKAASDATDIYEKILLTDWGKLQKIGGKIESLDEGWTWQTYGSDTVVNCMEPGFRASFYQSLMPIKWQIIMIDAMNSQSPSDYSYETTDTIYDDNGHDSAVTKTHTPYKDAPDYASWASPETSNTYVVFLLTDTDGNYPSEALMTDLFTTLNIPQTDFYNGLNGWNLNVVGPPTGD